ncbi:hypothetical protein PR048_028871 [Dryococelus australis]|uniref:Uncharacterized protein n=1 Tax=Dryococelus australis TaxID=614101 RepID=A0ABQ9GEF2_9NEOP|nr:hypothetical protein PR048_028871 [Dryococelus australis]
MVNLLASLGLSLYYEYQTLEVSDMAHTETDFKEGSFSQFVFDNADLNVFTLDGYNTSLAMVGIKCVTPASSAQRCSKISRLTKLATSNECGRLDITPLEIFHSIPNIQGGGLDNFVVEHLESQNIPIPEWKGFMNSITEGCYRERTKVVPLPLVNTPPLNYDTDYTSLRYAAELCGTIKQNCAIITFDQPLYWKAREIVAASPSDSQLSNTVVWLDRFYLLMSYLWCIGYLMGGSGVKKLFSTIYAQLSVYKMLQGHDFAGAVRGHLLVQTTLSNIIFSQLGVWSDMTIETKVMQSFKTNTCLTHRRCISDSVISKWIVEMSVTHGMCALLEEFRGVLFSPSVQHVDFRMTRITRNTTDIGKLAAWFRSHSLFPIMEGIMSIAPGVVEDCTIINCYEVVTTGKQTLSFFFKASPSVKKDDDLWMYLEHELVPFPLSLFNGSGMRKPKKSVMYAFFNTTKKDWNPSNFDMVIDGGYRMPKVIWPRGCAVSTIWDAYINRQAPGDADLLIVTTAIDKSKPLDKSTVAVIGEDGDLEVLLMAKTPTDRDVL